MDTLGKMFGSQARVKIMKLFLCNPSQCFEKSEIVNRSKVSSSTGGKELLLLQSIGFIKKKSFFREGKLLSSGKIGKKKRVSGFILNSSFDYLSALHRLLITSAPVESKDLAQRLLRVGSVKLIVLSGIFLENEDARVDLLVVGDGIKNSQLRMAVSVIESEVGRQLRYALFNTRDFKYRMSVCDRLLRDIFDYGHEVIVDKLGISDSLKSV